MRLKFPESAPLVDPVSIQFFPSAVVVARALPSVHGFRQRDGGTNRCSWVLQLHRHAGTMIERCTLHLLVSDIAITPTQTPPRSFKWPCR